MSTEISTYEQQAINFLKATNTTFKTKFEKFDYYFDDTQKRNIFICQLKNDKHKYSFRFGASLNDSLKNSNDVIYDKEVDFYCGFKFEGLKQKYLSYSDKISIEKIKANFNYEKSLFKLIDKKKAEKIYNEFVSANTSKYSNVNIFPLNRFIAEIENKLILKARELKEKNFGEGIPNDNVIHPTAYDVLASLTKNEVGSFDNFCDDYGYDKDSRKAYKTYKAILREWKNVGLLFTPDQLELLQEIN